MWGWRTIGAGLLLAAWLLPSRIAAPVARAAAASERASRAQPAASDPQLALVHAAASRVSFLASAGGDPRTALERPRVREYALDVAPQAAARPRAESVPEPSLAALLALAAAWCWRAQRP